MGMKTQYMKKHFYKNRIRSVLFWTVEIAAVLLLAALFSVFMCKSTVVQEGSMEPTLEAGNEVLINTAAYRFSSPKREILLRFVWAMTAVPVSTSSGSSVCRGRRF